MGADATVSYQTLQCGRLPDSRATEKHERSTLRRFGRREQLRDCA